MDKFFSLKPLYFETEGRFFVRTVNALPQVVIEGGSSVIPPTALQGRLAGLVDTLRYIV